MLSENNEQAETVYDCSPNGLCSAEKLNEESIQFDQCHITSIIICLVSIRFSIALRAKFVFTRESSYCFCILVF